MKSYQAVRTAKEV